MSYDRREFLKASLAGPAAAALSAPQARAQGPGFFPGFERRKIQTSGAVINTVHGGSGPPLLLIHGSPETHVEWHKIAPNLAQSFTVVMTDLRGYGDSSRPVDGDNHANYSKRAMALDQVEVMRALGFSRFAVVGHDRGGRVAWRLSVEHPDVVSRVAIIDIVPSPYSNVTREFATQYFHWFFLIQPAPLPETLIGNNAEYWLRSRLPAREGITPEAFAEYLRCFSDAVSIHANCEDYRAGASIDIEHAAEDGARRVACPLFVLWGEQGTVGRTNDVLKVWRDFAVNVSGKGLPARHFLPEQVPDETLTELLKFLRA